MFEINIVKIIFSILASFSSGAIISGAVFAFITIIGVVPRIAQKTNTTEYIKIYEEAIILGGIFGTTTLFLNIKFYIGEILLVLLGFFVGIFFGCLAVSLAEVLNVIPILARRIKIKKGIFIFLLSIALGKLIGSIIYFIFPGFYVEVR